jgi:hypothetical protein
MQKELTLTFSTPRSSTNPESSAPILNVPPEIITIPGGQVLTAANAGELLNSNINVIT